MIGRFQVMAVLQAARAYILGFPLDSAKSFGLNRAIFYAAAKKGFFREKKIDKKTALSKIKETVEKELKEEISKTFEITTVGDEMAYSVKIKGKAYFLIGNKIQMPSDFDKQIASKFGKHFEKVWKEALEICRSYDKGVLLSQRYFFEAVYKVRRDILAEKWRKLVEES